MKHFIFNFFLFILCILSIILACNTVQTEPITEVQKKYIIIENNFDYYEVTVTAYSPIRTETDNTPYKTALNQKPIPGGTVAVSRDLLKYLGNKVYIYQIGVFKVNDLMNRRFSKRIDICMGKTEAKKFGVKKNMKAVFFDD